MLDLSGRNLVHRLVVRVDHQHARSELQQQWIVFFPGVEKTPLLWCAVVDSKNRIRYRFPRDLFCGMRTQSEGEEERSDSARSTNNCTSFSQYLQTSSFRPSRHHCTISRPLPLF